MDLAKLGLKPFKKAEANDESRDMVGTTATTGSDSVHAAENAVASSALPAGGTSSGTQAPRPNPLAALVAKNKAPVVDAGKAEEQTSQSAPAKPQGSASALTALMAKQPKVEPKPESPGANLPAVLDIPVAESIPPGPEGFQFHLDRLDALIQRDGGITALTQDSIKGKIKDIFTELNQFPEYDGLIIDRDVHNIMRFMQHSLSAVQVATEKKVATRTKKAEEKAKPKFNFDLSGMDGMLIGATAAPKTIESLGTLDVDAIETKFRRGGK